LLEDAQRGALGVENMLARDLLRAPGVAALDAGQQRVYLVQAARQPVRQHQRCGAQQADARQQAAQDLADQRVARALEQDAIELGLGLEHTGRELLLAGFSQAANGLGQLLDLLVAGQPGELVRRKALEQPAQRIQIARLLQRDGSDLGPAVRHDDDQLLGFEPAQRLANRRSADTQHLAQLALDQLLTGLELAADDGLAQLVLDPRAQGLRLDQRE
jgi:hypothetical protein